MATVWEQICNAGDTATNDDAAIAHNILTLLFDAYGYRGAPALQVTTEQ